MKVNQPVTQREIPMTKGTILVSKTNLKGIITYCNDDFIKISGFTEEELIGSNHNLVRHPDMPPAAFADLWATVKRGQPWCGIVKNRAKNGDHYWVYANVTPIYENGEIVEFMSVRTKPSAHQIEEAKKQYRDLKQTRHAGRNIFTQHKHPRGKLARLWRSNPFSLYTTAAVALQLLAITTMLAGTPAAVTLALMVATLVPIGLAAKTFQIHVHQPLDHISSKLSSLLEGNFFDWIEPVEDDQCGKIMRQLRMIQIKLGFDVIDANDTVLKLLNLVSRLDDLSLRFNQSAASMEESAANITEINSLVKNNAQNAADADEMANTTMERVDESRLALDKAVKAMSSINDATTRIADIIGVIDEIAFKTNLLALNASVEAAHAGDQGKGFAVVANEVRNLSQHTTTAASEVKQLIHDSIGKVKDGAGMIDLSDAALKDTVAEMKRVTKIISEISASGKEQAIGIEMLSENIQTINETLQHTTHLIQETADQSGHIGERAEEYVEKSKIKTAA